LKDFRINNQLSIKPIYLLLLSSFKVIIIINIIIIITIAIYSYYYSIINIIKYAVLFSTHIHIWNNGIPNIHIFLFILMIINSSMNVMTKIKKYLSTSLISIIQWYSIMIMYSRIILLFQYVYKNIFIFFLYFLFLVWKI